MSRFSVERSWCHVEQLDGKAIAGGEIVVLQWPDGQRSRHGVLVERRNHECEDMGVRTPFPVVLGVVEVSHNGATLRVYLSELVEFIVNDTLAR